MKKKYLQIELPKGKIVKYKPIYNPISDTIIIRLKEDENPDKNKRKEVQH